MSCIDWKSPSALIISLMKPHKQRIWSLTAEWYWQLVYYQPTSAQRLKVCFANVSSYCRCWGTAYYGTAVEWHHVTLGTRSKLNQTCVTECGLSWVLKSVGSFFLSLYNHHGKVNLKCVLCLCCMFLRVSHFLSTELHVFSGPEVSNQSVHSHTAGSHHSLPCTGSSGKTHAHTHPQADMHTDTN